MQFAIRCARHVVKVVRRDRRNRWRKKKRLHRERLWPLDLQTIERTALQDGLNHAPRDRKLIISLASYPPRFPLLEVVLKRLLDQTLKPDRLILYLDDFVKPEDVPDAVRGLTRYGLEIRYVPHDLRPHKKYFFSMQEFPDDLIITVDDDEIYPRNLAETLVASWRRFPDCVSAVRAHKITFTGAGEVRPYGEWEWECGDLNRPSMRYLATGVGGVLYPPHVIPPEGFDPGVIRDTSLNNDDLWLKFMEMRTGTKVVICGRQALLDTLEIEEAQQTALRTDNVKHGANDVCFALLMAREHRTAGDFRR
jgi:hypothetical protein